MISLATSLGDLWPATEKPQNDELLSSWVYRIARNHGLSLYDFGYRIWKQLSITGDIDYYYSQAIISTLCSKTIFNFNQIHNLTLKSFEGILFKDFNPTKVNPWILVKRNERVHKYFIVYCSKCFEQDRETPYLRKKWRLSFSITCPKCNCYLMEVCPQCGSPFSYVKHNRSSISNINFCGICKYDLAKAKIRKADNELIEIQKIIYRFVDDKTWNVNENNPYPHLLEVLHHLIPLIYQDRIKITCLTRNGITPPRDKKRSPNFSLLRLKDREMLLREVFYLLEDWPFKFIEIVLKSRLYDESTFKKFDNAPYWYSSICSELFKLV